MSAQLGKVVKQAVQKKKVGAFQKWWASTRDLPELWVVYIGVGAAAAASIYNLKKTYLNDLSGSYLDPDIRGDPMEQSEEARVGRKDGEKDSLWWRLAQVKNSPEGPNIGVGPFVNRQVSRATDPDIRSPGYDRPQAGNENVQKTPPLVG